MLSFKFNATILLYCILLLYGYVLSEDHDEIPTIARYFGPKGRYEEVNPYLLKDMLAVNKSTLHLPSPQCREMHMTAIIRHGTRYPTTMTIKKMHWLYNFIVNNTSSEKSWLQQEPWRVWYTEDMDGRLVQKGVDELKHLAVRLSKMFPTLISEEKLRGGFINFITSSKHRCVTSTLAFKRGLTELWNITDIDIEHEVNDALMRFFDHCARLKAIDTNSSAVVEVDKFKTGPEMSKVLEKMADKLNVTHNSVTYDMVEAVFFLCAYEFTINNTVSPWCQLFDEEDAKVMEYVGDLREYWKRGYGHDINFMSSCILFHDVFKRLDKAAAQILSGQEVTNAVTVQIGHADTLLPLLTLLGFFKDSEPLTSENYATQNKRTFRTSHMLPYTANLVLVLYNCGDGELRVQSLLNEMTVTFPHLKENQSSMPLFTDVKKHYKELLQGCDFDTECQLKHLDED